MNLEVGDFKANLEGGEGDAGKSGEQNVPDEPEGI